MKTSELIQKLQSAISDGFDPEVRIAEATTCRPEEIEFVELRDGDGSQPSNGSLVVICGMRPLYGKHEKAL